MSKINLDRVRNVFKESTKTDEQIYRSTSDQALLRSRRMAADQAKAAYVSDESIYNSEATIDPYDTTTKASKTSKKDLLTLSGSNYRTSLLEQLVKNQNNKELNTSILTFQDKALTYLDSIENILKTQFAPDNKNQDSFYNTNKSLEREISDLAKAMTELNPENMAKAMAKGFKSQFGLDQITGMADLAFSTVKEAIKSGDIGTMIKTTIQDQMINALPKNARDKVRRFKDDPANFFQDVINTLALDRNATVAQIFRPHARGFKPEANREKFDAKALAKFDNKFYTSVTQIMPDQLLKMNTYLEKLATGKVSDIQTFDWDKGDYTSLLKDVKGFLDKSTTNQKATDEIYKDLTDQLQTIIEKGTDKSGLLSRKTKRDEYGIFDLDDDGTVKFTDKEDLKTLISAIINSKGGFNELRGSSINIEQYLKDNELGYKTVAGKTVKKSDQEIALMRNNLLTLRTILTSMDPEAATKLEGSLMGFKRSLSEQGKLDTRGWNQDILRSMVDVANSAAAPETLRNVFGPNGYFGGGSGPVGPGPGGGDSGPTQTSSTSSSSSTAPQLYRNSQGQMVPWDQLTDNERSSITRAYIKDHKFGDRLSEDTIFKHISRVQSSETPEAKRVRNAYEHGVLTTAEFEDYMNGVRPYNTYKEKLDNYDAAIAIFNDLDSMGLTAAQMRAGNSNLSLRDYENLGYMSSPEQLTQYIKNGKLDVDRLSQMNSMYSQHFADNLNQIARDKQRAAEFETYDPAGSVSNIFNSIFGDPRISKKAGIAAGTAAGLGINKLLKMSGIVDSPKLGILLGGVGAALMMTERAQNMVKDIFGPEGDVRGESGFTNKEIFMSRLMTRWLPSIGAGTKVASATAKFFSKGGPVMAMMGIPAALVTGLTASWVAPKLVEFAQNKMFSKEARESGSFLGKAGEFIKNLNIPFINKYIIGDKGESSQLDIQISAVSRELQTLGRERADLEMKLKDPNLPDDKKAEYESRLNVVKKDFELYDKALSDLRSLKSAHYTEEEVPFKITEILGRLEEGLSNNSKESFTRSREQSQANAEFNAGGAAKSKFSTAKDRANSAYTRFIQDGGDPESETARRLASLGTNGSLDETFNDYSSSNANRSISQYEIINKLKGTTDFSHNDIDDLIKSMAGKTQDEKIALLDQYVSSKPNSESAPLVRDYIKSKLAQDSEKTQLFQAVFAVQKALHPELSDYDLQLITNNEVAGLLNRGRTKAAANYAREQGTNIVWNEIRARYQDTFRGPLEGDNIKDQGMTSMNELYSEITNTNVSQGGTGTEGDSKIYKMSELKDSRFKNGASLSTSGCSVVAFNNALYYLNIPQVEINTLVSVANKYLTSDGGVTSEFFLEMCQRLNITAKIYNSTDNRFSIDTLRQLAPDKTKSLIVLLRNTNNNGAHYVTIKSVGSTSCVVNDPEVNGTVDMSISTIIARAIEFILISKSAAINNKLTESEESKSFATKFKEWFKTTKVGKAVESFKTAYSMAKTGINKVKDILSPSSIKDAIGGFFSRNNNHKEETKDSPSRTETLLQEILDKLSGIYDKPLPVSVWEDYTLALQSNDERASLALIDSAASTSSSSAELTNAKRIKNLRRRREIQKEREEAQAVQDKIINGESLIAGTSTRVGGRGTGAAGSGTGEPGSGADPDNTQVAEQAKAGLLGTIFGKPIAAVAGKFLPWLAGGAVAAAPTYLAYKLAKPYAQMSVNQTKALFQEETENVVDENGMVTEGGQYKDPTGLARNVWNMKSLAKGVFSLNKKMATGFGGLATKIASKTASITTKIGQWGSRGGKVAQTAAKYGGKAAKVIGTGAEYFAKGGKAIAGLLSSDIIAKLGKIIDKVTSLKNFPFVGKAAEFIASKLTPLLMWLKGKGMKVIQAITKKALSPQNAGRKIPFVGLGLSVIQAAAAIINGYRKAAEILRIPEEVVTLKHKLMSAAAKFLWDALPMVASSAIATVTGGVGGIAADACIAIFQMVYGFDNFLIDFFGCDDNWRKEMGAEYKSIEEEQDKNGEESLKKELDEGSKEVDDKANQAEKEAKKAQDDVSSKIAEENNKKNDMPGVDVTKEADSVTDQAKLHKEYFFGEKSIAGKIERWGDKGAREQKKLRKEYGEEYEKKRREEVMNSPSVKAAMEAWKANPGEFFHPMGKNDTRITSVFGPRNVQGGSKNHRGVDFSSGGQSGKPVYAYKAGKVITNNRNYGLIEIQHSDGTVSRYMHLSDRFPQVGQEVAMGEVIGTSGGIGKNGASAYVPHLHFEVRDGAGKNLDPFLQMSLDPKVINVAPAWKNRENIAYFERYPWLKEKDGQADNKIAQAEKADSNSSNSNKTPTLTDKPVGGPSDTSELYDKNYKSDLEKSKSVKPDKSNADRSVIAMGVNNKDDLIVQLLQQQVQLMKQNSQLMQTLVSLVGEIKSTGENSNNDMLGALSMSRF